MFMNRKQCLFSIFVDKIMAKNKLRKFAEMKAWNNVFEPTLDPETRNNFPLKGKWRSDYFKNENPIVLELGCGKGEYTTGLARHYPERNFIGIDIKGARIFVGAKEALDEELNNVAFLRAKIDFIETYFDASEVENVSHISSTSLASKYVAFLRAKIDFIETYFDASEVDEIWLTFSDPQPAKPRKRLTSEQFINRYKTILKRDGLVHLKTDRSEE